ncbi:MAG TPA: MYXO-CTERM sorting domain-containing protein, partial [Polyangia bacterium]|nr:MYXO-CTERM sorting domain-containing protein [Polyangia bacterium]
EAGGNAFIAEYAGTARILDRALWPDPRVDLTVLRALAAPPSYLQALIFQGLNGSSQLLSLLRTYIPEPQILKDMGIPEGTFYANNALYWSQYRSAFAPFDPAKLTDEIDRAIVAPLRDGQTLFDAHPYLTRLATFISPIEMTSDPIFIFNSDLPPLSNVHRATARIQCGDQAYTYCEAPVRYDLPGGQSIWQEHYCSYPSKVGEVIDGPSLLAAYQRAEGGDGTPVADNTKLIAGGVMMHNQAVAAALALPPTALMPDGSPKAPIALAPMNPVNGAGVAGGGGCGCRLGGGAGAPMAASALALALAAAALARRRRQR